LGDAVAKNVVIYSDGTGQAGGFRFDEKRSNIYKLYRATRCGPDSCIDPKEQIAFYDPGLGSEADGGGLWGGFVRRVYNLVSQATGFGITANIVDCYAALIRLWEPGDRIFLFGFSRGAYTVRCQGGVLTYCGIPTHLKGGHPLKLDLGSTLKLARYAVKHIYQFTASRKYEAAPPRQQFLLDTRDLLGKRLREEHGSAAGDDANVYPYFVGVFDTVASLGSRSAFVSIVVVGLIAAVVIGIAIYALFALLQLPFRLPYIGELALGGAVLTAIIVVALLSLITAAVVYVVSHLKWDFAVPGYGFWQSLRTLHFTQPKQRFYDARLDAHVRYATHALAIDENRKDFDRVRWGKKNEERPARDEDGHVWFEQVWFAGNHSDIGGSYPENESRLSDIALKWMVDCATVVSNGLRHDPSVLRLFGSPGGVQHDEVKAGLGLVTTLVGRTWEQKYRELVHEATMHPSVYERFDLEQVLLYDELRPYRPDSLKEHVELSLLPGGRAVSGHLGQRRALAANPLVPLKPAAGPAQARAKLRDPANLKGEGET
jgi:uncharacterized protein (DUF2235 family)